VPEGTQDDSATSFRPVPAEGHLARTAGHYHGCHPERGEGPAFGSRAQETRAGGPEPALSEAEGFAPGFWALRWPGACPELAEGRPVFGR
jgi:hypothetical protein